MRGPERLMLPATLAGVLVAGAALALAGDYLIDDAFISYRYAEHLAQGRGLTFNPGERVEGYSNLLWVLFSAGVVAVGGDPVSATRALGVASLLGTLGVLFRFLRSRLQRAELPVAEACLLLMVAGLDRSFARFSATGMETAFFAMLLAAFACAQALPDDPGPGGRLAWGLLPLALCLTRPDGLLFVAVGAVARWWHFRRSGDPAARAAARTARWLSPCGAGLLVLLAWRWWYYGSLLPNTFFAKTADQSHWAEGAAYLLTYLASNLHVAMLLPFVAVGLATARGTRDAPLALFCGLSLSLYCLYVARVGGDFMEYRFMLQVYPLVVLLAALGVGRLAPHARGGALLALALALAGTSGSRVLESAGGMQSLEEMADYARRGRDVGKALRATLPPDTVIATKLAGTVPYYSGLPTVDQWGLNDAGVMRQGRLVERFNRGHRWLASPEYLVRRGVNLVLNHPETCACSPACWREGSRDVLIRISDEACVRAEYLVPTPRLTALFCSGGPFVLSSRETLCGPPPAGAP